MVKIKKDIRATLSMQELKRSGDQGTRYIEITPYTSSTSSIVTSSNTVEGDGWRPRDKKRSTGLPSVFGLGLGLRSHAHVT